MFTRNSKSAIGMFYSLNCSTNLSNVVSKVILSEIVLFWDDDM